MWISWARYVLARMGGQRGQAMSEYGLVLAIVALGVIAALIVLRDQLVELFHDIAIELTT